MRRREVQRNRTVDDADGGGSGRYHVRYLQRRPVVRPDACQRYTVDRYLCLCCQDLGAVSRSVDRGRRGGHSGNGGRGHVGSNSQHCVDQLHVGGAPDATGRLPPAALPDLEATASSMAVRFMTTAARVGAATSGTPTTAQSRGGTPFGAAELAGSWSSAASPFQPPSSGRLRWRRRSSAPCHTRQSRVGHGGRDREAAVSRGVGRRHVSGRGRQDRHAAVRRRLFVVDGRVVFCGRFGAEGAGGRCDHPPAPPHLPVAR